MKIAICGSLDFSFEMMHLKKQLEAFGFEVVLPPTAEKIISGMISLDEIKREKQADIFSKRISSDDAIRRYFGIIKDCDAILVANYEKNNVKGYIGGNAFLEMGFAHVLNKKLFLLNEVPKLNYAEEIAGMNPIVLNGDLSRIE